MNRREFLQLTGAAAAGGVLSSCTMNPEKLIPLLVPPEDGAVPGVADYYASTCRQCPAGCGIIVRVSEGRANKIEGNPLHPVNKGKLCARGQAALQALYHPDRIRQPLKRSGPRGSGAFSPISWDEGVRLIAEKLEAERNTGSNKGMMVLTPELSGSMLQLVRAFTEYFNGIHVPYEPFSAEIHREASLSLYGRPEIPDYDIENAQYIISFGADFLETFASPVRYGVAYGKMRRGRATVRGLFTYAGPRMSMTAASADRWLPVKGGREGLLALGMAGIIINENMYDRSAFARHGIDTGRIESIMKEYPLERIASETDIPAHDIFSAARDFARLGPSLAIAGDTVACHTNGLESLKAVHLLNLLAGNAGRPGGVRFAPKGLVRAGSRYSDLLDSIDAMSAGTVRLVLIHNADPVYSLPKKSGFEKALDKAPYITCFSSFLSDTALHADLILPDHTDLESWGDIVPSIGGDSGTVGIMQPVVRPLYDTRSFYDVLLSLANFQKDNVPAPLKYSGYPEMLKNYLKTGPGLGPENDFERKWIEALQRGGVFKEIKEDVSAISPGKYVVTVPPAAVFTGDEEGFPFHLHLYPSPILFDGRSAHIPWLQETPDPMSTAVWGSWIEINTETARSLGIAHGDLVEVESTAGTVRTAAFVSPALRPEVVAMPLGQGHRNFGRYAKGRGVNPLDLIDPAFDKENRLPAPGAARVRIKRLSKEGGLITSGHPEGSYRGELLEI